MKSSRWVSVAVVLVVLVILFRNLRYLYAHNVGMGWFWGLSVVAAGGAVLICALLAGKSQTKTVRASLFIGTIALVVSGFLVTVYWR